MVYLFDVAAYFILLRETLECTIILAVLYGFIDKLVPNDTTLSRKFKRQILFGTLAGLGVSLILGAIFIVVFYVISKNLWEESEMLWEGIFALIACIVITIMAFSMVKVAKWKKKWEDKLEASTTKYLENQNKGEKMTLFFLPFTVICREGVETIIFIAGIGYNESPTGLPIPVICGMLSGVLIGYFIYKGSHVMTLKLFFGTMTALLFFIAAGLFSTSIHEFEEYTENENFVWKLECCSPDTNYGWKIANVIFGWREEATVGTLVGYITYWVVTIIGLLYLRTKKETDPEKLDRKSVV